MSQIEQYLLEATIPVRLAVVSPTGMPFVASLWFLWDGRALWCATQAKSRVVESLRQRPQVGFEVAADAPPYRGVRGQGVATIDEAGGESILEQLLVRYRIAPQSRLARGLRRNLATEVAIRIVPSRLACWDFTERMSDAIATG